MFSCNLCFLNTKEFSSFLEFSSTFLIFTANFRNIFFEKSKVFPTVSKKILQILKQLSILNKNLTEYVKISAESSNTNYDSKILSYL